MSTAHAIRRSLAVVALALGFAAVAPVAPAQNDKNDKNDKQEVKFLHILLVMDTSDPNLDRGVRKDQRNITRLLEDNIPKNRYDLKVLVGDKITSEQVFSYYKNLKIDPADGLLFYYSGHGAIVEGKGHTLEIQGASQAIRRSDLLKAMKEKNAALTMVLTDCCSNRITFADERKFAEATGRDFPLEPTPLVRKLMFQTRGVIDITAATNDVALADDYQGGYFTKALCRITEKEKDNKKGMGWKEYFTAVSSDIGVIQKDAQARGILPIGEKLKIQVPTAFSLAAETVSSTTTAGTGTTTTPAARVAAIIGLANPATEEIEIQYRWDPKHEWSKKKIPAGGKVSLGTVIPATMTKTPPLIVRVNGQEQTLETTRFEQARAPKLSDATVYKLGEKKDPGTRGVARSFELDPSPTPETPPAPVVLEAPLPAPPVGSPVIEK